jgi:tetratricopeptide (TPR) repeat protein
MQLDPSLFKKDRIGRSLQFIFHHNHFTNFISLKMMGQAQQALLWLYDSMSAEKNGKLLNRMRRHYRQDYYLFEMENGRFDDAESVFQDMFDSAHDNYMRVYAMLALGRIHAHFRQIDRACQAFEYVIAHGNKLYAVTLAEKHLISLSNV